MLLRIAPPLVFLVALMSWPAQPVEARLTRLQIDQREVVAEGQAFGAAGAYERLSGTAYF